jgi:hypothetical protein
VLFGEKGNIRREPIWFEVVDISSPYHTLLGCPALAKFMVVPHYAYLKMKLLGPRGVITILGCYKKLMECARASSKLAEALVIAEEKCNVVTQQTTACCSIKVVDITLVKYQFTNITSLRVVQHKHSGLYSSTEYYKP